MSAATPVGACGGESEPPPANPPAESPPPLPAANPEPEPVRVLRVRVVVDDEFRRRPAWRNEIEGRVAVASRRFEEAHRIRFVIGEVNDWESDDDAESIDDLLRDMDGDTRAAPYDLVWGFVGQHESSEKGAEPYDRWWSAWWYGRKLLLHVPDGVDRRDRYGDHLLAAIATLFGAWGTEYPGDGPGVRSRSQWRATGPIARAAIALQRDRDFSQRVESVTDEVAVRLGTMWRNTHLPDREFELVDELVSRADRVRYDNHEAHRGRRMYERAVLAAEAAYGADDPHLIPALIGLRGLVPPDREVEHTERLVKLVDAWLDDAKRKRKRERPARTVTVTVAVDEEARVRKGWRTWTDGMIAVLNWIYDDEFDLRFDVRDVVEWDSDDDHTVLGDLLDEVAGEIPAPETDIVIAFTGQLRAGHWNADERYEYTGRAQIFGRACLVGGADARDDEPYYDEILLHEVAHVFGVWHNADDDSVMRPQFRSEEAYWFDSTSSQAIELTRERSFGAGVEGLDPRRDAQLLKLYLADHAEDTDFTVLSCVRRRAGSATNRRDYDRARQLRVRELRILEGWVGTHSPRLVNCFVSLAVVCDLAGNRRDAEKYADLALLLLERPPPKEPDDWPNVDPKPDLARLRAMLAWKDAGPRALDLRKRLDLLAPPGPAVPEKTRKH